MRLAVLLACSLLLLPCADAADNSAVILKMSDKEFAAEMKAGTELYSQNLPMRVDVITVLQGVSYTHFDKTYLYRYTTSNMIDANSQRAAIIRQLCSSPNLTAFMKRGVTLRSLYFGPNQKMTDIEVRLADCSR